MSKEHFSELLLIQSLELQIKQHLNNIKEQEERLKSLNHLISSRMDDCKTRETELQEIVKQRIVLEKKMTTQDKRAAQIGTHLNDNPHFSEIEKLNNEKNILEQEISDFENNILSCLDRESLLQQEIDEAKTFLTGSAHTLKELTSEMNVIKDEENSKIALLEKRIETHFSNMPKLFKDSYQEANKKYRFNHPIAYLEDRICSLCRFQQDHTAIVNIKEFKIIEFCGGCYRILTLKI